MVVVDSRIDRVKVYRTGATVTRRVTLKLEGGALPDEIEVRPLPLALYDATVRVSVEGTGADGDDLVATDVRVGLAPRTEPESVSDPDEEALKSAERDRLRAWRRTEQLDDEVRALEAIPVPDRARGRDGRPPPSSPMTARSALDRFTAEAVSERRRERREAREELRRLDERIKELKDARERATTARRLTPGDLVKTVIARLVSSGAPCKQADVVVEYFVPGARWAPAYQCHLARDGSSASIQLRALVCQKSGEDWRGVRLALSTAAPLRWTELPELAAIRIGRAQPPAPKPRGFRPPPKGASALFSDYDVGRERAAGLLPRTTSWQPPHLELSPLDAGALPPRGRPGPAPVAEVSRAMPRAPAPARPSARALAKSARGDAITSEGLAEDDDDELCDMAEPEPLGALLDDADAFEATTDARQESLAEMRSSAVPMKAAPGGPPLGGMQLAIEAYAFAHLVLGAADDRAARNRLLPVDERRRYLDILARAKVTVAFDVVTVVEGATRDAEAVASLPMPEGAVDVGRVSGSYDFAYDADDAVDVGSDGAWSSVPLGTRACEAELRYVVVPREDPSVFRVAMLKNPVRAPLLAGPTEVYVGGEYVLTTRLPTVAPGGELRLGLGVEQAVKCARNTRYRERHSGDRVGMTLLEHGIEIDLVNHLARDASVEVRERIPQPDANAEVMVDEEQVEPPWEEYDQEERSALVVGGRRWLVTVPAHGEKKLAASYVVRIYANTELVGGNRREA